jgi:hypothetical protein
MKTFLWIVLILLNITCSWAQGTIVIEEADLNSLAEGAKVPRVKDTANPGNSMVTKINKVILERFEIESFNQKEIKEFNWSGVTFKSEVKSGIAYIRYEGEYMAAHPSVVAEELFFDLQTGELLKNADIPFQSLFSLGGYLDFLNKYWLTGVKKAFQEAVTCADAQPDCSYYDISEYTFEKSKLLVKLQSDCYPHAAMACTPKFSITVSLDSIKKYLSPAGEKILLRDKYPEKKGVDKYLYNNKAWKEIPNSIFLFGLIDGKYPISMAIAINKAGAVDGYYYYDKRKQKLRLTGMFQNGIMQLIETVDSRKTGEFYLTWVDQYQEDGLAVYGTTSEPMYVNGEWIGSDGLKKLKIEWKEVKITGKSLQQ